MKTVRKNGENRQDINESNLGNCIPSVRLSHHVGLLHSFQSLQSYCCQTRSRNINRDSLENNKQMKRTIESPGTFDYEKIILFFEQNMSCDYLFYFDNENVDGRMINLILDF